MRGVNWQRKDVSWTKEIYIYIYIYIYINRYPISYIHMGNIPIRDSLHSSPLQPTPCRAAADGAGAAGPWGGRRCPRWCECLMVYFHIGYWIFIYVYIYIYIYILPIAYCLLPIASGQLPPMARTPKANQADVDANAHRCCRR